jgi:hypothetical protein
MNKKNLFVLQIPKKISVYNKKEKTFFYKKDLPYFDLLKIKGENLKDKKKLLQLNKKTKFQIVGSLNLNSSSLYYSKNNKIIKQESETNLLKLQSIFFVFYHLL